jgi:signal peptidase I
MKIVRRAAGLLVGTMWLGACALILLMVFAFGPTLLGYETMIVTSGSMGKAMPVGSVAQTKLAPAGAIAVGDIVSFRLPTANVPTTHRVVGVERDGASFILHTKGDANQTADPEPVIIKQTESIQRVERVVPYAGTVVHDARGPVGMLALFGIPLVGLIFDHGKKTKDRSHTTPAIAPAQTVTIAFASTATFTPTSGLKRKRSAKHA